MSDQEKLQEIIDAVAALNLDLAWMENGAGTYVSVKVADLKRILLAVKVLKNV